MSDAPPTEERPPESALPESDRVNRRRTREFAVYGTYMAMGFEIAAAIVIPLLAGGWADRRWHTSPVFLVTGVVLGFATALRILIRYLRIFQRENQADVERVARERRSQLARPDAGELDDRRPPD